MSDDIKFGITADNTGMMAALTEVKAAVGSATEEIKGSFEKVAGVFDLVGKAMGIFTAVLAGGKIFKEAIDATVGLTKESVSLGRQFGISATEASDLKQALDNILVTQDQFAAAGNAMTKTLRQHEDVFQAAGIATRDQNGNLRNSVDIILDVNAHLASLKEGTDRNIEGMRFYGKAWAEVAPTIKLTAATIEEAKKSAQELGLEVGERDVAQTKAYRVAMQEMHDVFEGVWKVIGDALLPILIQLGQWFGEVGPQVVATFRQAVGTVELAFYGLKAIGQFVWEELSYGAQRAAFIFLTFAATAQRALRLDFAGAKTAWNTGMGDLEQLSKQHNAKLEADARETAEKIKKIWAVDFLQQKDPDNKPIPRPAGGGNASDVDPKKSRLSDFKTELEERKATFAQENAAQNQFQEFSKQSELDYWQNILATVKLSKEERLGVRSEIAKLEIAIAKDSFDTQLAQLKEQEAQYKDNLDARLNIARQYADKISAAFGSDSKEYAAAAKEIVAIEREKSAQLQQIEAERMRQNENRALAEVSSEEESARLRTDLGMQTNAKLLAQEQQFENRRYAIKLKALKDEQMLAAQSPDRNPAQIAKLNSQIEALQIQHEANLAKISGNSSRESTKYWTSAFSAMRSGFSTVIANFLNGTASLSQTLQGLWKAIGSAIINTIAEVAAEWIVQQAEQIILGKASAASQISANAGVAATAAMASVAAIPFVGWAMAPGVGASTFALAESYNASLAAERGFDIPSGLNPVTQLHQREMVLPAPYADVVRNMANKSAGSGDANQARQGGTIKLYGKPSDKVSVDQVVAALKSAGHRFKLA